MEKNQSVQLLMKPADIIEYQKICLANSIDPNLSEEQRAAYRNSLMHAQILLDTAAVQTIFHYREQLIIDSGKFEPNALRQLAEGLSNGANLLNPPSDSQVKGQKEIPFQEVENPETPTVVVSEDEKKAIETKQPIKQDDRVKAITDFSITPEEIKSDEDLKKALEAYLMDGAKPRQIFPATNLMRQVNTEYKDKSLGELMKVIIDTFGIKSAFIKGFAGYVKKQLLTEPKHPSAALMRIKYQYDKENLASDDDIKSLMKYLLSIVSYAPEEKEDIETILKRQYDQAYFDNVLSYSTFKNQVVAMLGKQLTDDELILEMRRWESLKVDAEVKKAKTNKPKEKGYKKEKK